MGLAVWNIPCTYILIVVETYVHTLSTFEDCPKVATITILKRRYSPTITAIQGDTMLVWLRD